MSDIEHTGEVIHDSEWVTVWYHSRAAIVHHKIHKAIRGAPFRTALIKGAEALKKHGAKKWLSDTRHHFILTPEDEQWVNDEWFPKALQTGWKYWAIVRPEKAVAVLGMRRMAAVRNAEGVLTQLFATPAEGMKWLRAQPAGAPLAQQSHLTHKPKREV